MLASYRLSSLLEWLPWLMPLALAVGIDGLLLRGSVKVPTARPGMFAVVLLLIITGCATVCRFRAADPVASRHAGRVISAMTVLAARHRAFPQARVTGPLGWCCVFVAHARFLSLSRQLGHGLSAGTTASILELRRSFSTLSHGSFALGRALSPRAAIRIPQSEGIHLPLIRRALPSTCVSATKWRHASRDRLRCIEFVSDVFVARGLAISSRAGRPRPTLASPPDSCGCSSRCRRRPFACSARNRMPFMANNAGIRQTRGFTRFVRH